MKKHIWYYSGFILVEFTGLIILFSLSYDRYLQILTLLFMTLFYLLWSLVHHYFHHNLTPKIVIEYMLIGILGIVIALFFL
ncbi:MAG TPA: hypothetical protein VF810_02490 [Patescibacteria group bacterium]